MVSASSLAIAPQEIDMKDAQSGWRTLPLGKIAPLQRGFDLPTAKVETGEVPIVYSNGVERFHNKAMVKGPGVVTGRSGTLGAVHFIERDFWPHNTSLWVTDFNGNAPKFIYYLYSFIGFQRFASGSGVPTLNRNDAHSFEASLPSSIVEQEAIAEALSDADALIASLEALIVKKRAIKQGAMQELLTAQRRLPGFSGDWSHSALGSLGAWVGGGTPSMSRDDYWRNGTVPWASSADIRLGEMSAELRFISDRAISETSARLVPTGSIVVVTRSGILRRFLPVCVLRNPVAINQDIKALVPTNMKQSGFIAHSLVCHNEAILSTCLKAGTTVESIELAWLKKHQIMVPPTDEECEKVCGVLDELDAEIKSFERKLRKARQIKQGMMQDLLTGRVRLV